MDDPGQKLKRARERLNLRYRDVEEASIRIAERHKNDEFSIALSRLSDIENKGTVPTIYRIYSLCAIYRLEFHEVLEWYGVGLSGLPGDAALCPVERTHVLPFPSDGFGEVQVPLSLDPGLDLRKTTYLSRLIQRWGRLPLALLNGLDLKNYRYAFIGSEDWSMHPIILPGSLVVIDETKRKITASGWTNEFDRPIYFFEHREGYACGWSSLEEDRLIIQAHPSSQCAPRILPPDEVDIIGQVTGVAMLLDQAKRRRSRA